MSVKLIHQLVSIQATLWMFSSMRLSSSTLLPHLRWQSIKRSALSCLWSMSMLLITQNQNCQRYTVSGLSLSGDYFYSLTDYLWYEDVLHHHKFMDNNEIQQLVLPHCLHQSVLQSLHDDNGHQGLQHMVELLHSKVYWPSMFANTNCWLSQCERCHITKGDYTEPKTQQRSLIDHQPLELLCIDFTKADVARGEKENILVLIDTFSKFSQAFVTSSQKSLVIAKLLVEKWFSIFGIPAQIHSDQGRSFNNKIIYHLCKMYGIHQSTTTPYNPHGNALCKWFNCTLFGLMKTLTEDQKPNWPVYLPSLIYAYNVTPHASTGFPAIWTYVWAQSTNTLQWLVGTSIL